MPAGPALPAAPEESAIGGTPAGRAANAALRCFSKAARAFSLYDAQNEAVRRFLEEYRDALRDFLAAHGALDLEVRPYELALRGEVVHAEKDREKSLAYRLYRDGVRRLVIDPGATWDEELRLLEVLSVRFIGVRQQEEDAVTLLTRAAFRSIHFDSAAGLVAQKDDEDDAPPQRKASARQFPADFDGPVPPVLPPRQFGYFEIPPLALAAFEEEESAATLPGNAVRMVRELLDDADQAELATLVPAVEEVRDFLLADLDVKNLRDLARVVAGQHGKAAAVLGPALRPLAAPYTLQKLLAAIPAGEPAPDALMELLDLLGRYGADLFDPLIDRLAASGGDKTLEALATRAGRGKKQRILARLGTADGALVAVLLKILRAQDAAALPEAVQPLLANPDPGAQVAGIRLLDEAHAGEESDARLASALHAPEAEVRIAAADAIARRQIKKAFTALHDALEAREATLEAREAESLGAALGAVAPREARELFASWIRPPQSGLLSRLVARKPKKMLLWACASGLAQIAGEQTPVLLREAAAQGDEDLRHHCLKSMSLWRKKHG